MYSFFFFFFFFVFLVYCSHFRVWQRKGRNNCTKYVRSLSRLHSHAHAFMLIHTHTHMHTCIESLVFGKTLVHTYLCSDNHLNIVYINLWIFCDLCSSCFLFSLFFFHSIIDHSQISFTKSLRSNLT